MEEVDKCSSLEAPLRAKKWPQILAAFSTTLGAFGLGCGMAWTSPVLPNLVDCEDNPEKPDGCSFDTEFTENEGSWIGSSYTLGALVSSLFTGYCLAKLGRKYTMLLMAVPFSAGWILLTLTGPLDLAEAFWFYIGRVLTGFGAGSFALAAPIYILEISEPHIRGGLGILMQFMVTSGNVFVNGVGSVLPWEILTGIVIVFPVTMALMMSFMPESPYVLLVKGKQDEAAKSLQWLRGKHYDIGKEMASLRKTYEEQKIIGSISLMDLIKKDVYWKPLLLMLAIHFTQQFCGINAIVFYLTDIFLKAGLDIDNSLAAAAMVSLTQVFATGASIFLVERFGRKILLLFSSSGMSVSILALGLFFFMDEHAEVICDKDSTCSAQDGFSQDLLEKLGWLPLTSLIIYKFFFAIGYGPLPWMMNGEFFSLEAKGLSSSLATAFNWLCAFLVTKFEVNIEDAINTSGAYFMYSGVCLVATFFVFFFVPETKGKSSSDMRDIFDKKVGKDKA